MPNKKYYNSNEERKVKIVCIDCRKTFLCPLHLKGYRNQCLICFKKSRFQNSEIFVNDSSLSIGSNINNNNDNDKKNELLTFSNNSQRKKLKSENKKINLNSTF